MDFLYGLGATILVIVFFYKSFPTLTVFVGVSYVAYKLYGIIYRSRWLEKLHFNQLVATEVQRQKTREEEWRDYQMPDAKQFLRDTQYLKSIPAVQQAHLSLTFAYLSAEFDHQKLRPAEALALYQRFVIATNEALPEYEKLLPTALTQGGTSPFTQNYTPTSEELRPANEFLAERFNTFTEMLPEVQADLPDPPEFVVWDEDKIASEQRAFERKQKDYEKLAEQTYAAQTPEQRIFWGSSLYPLAERFAPQPVSVSLSIDPSKWFETCWVVASQGRGKSNLLRQLVLHHADDACIIILDPKGDLIETFKKHEPFKDRLVILDPSPEHPLAINPLDIGHSTEFIRYVFELLNAGMSTNHGTLVYYTMLLCKQIEGASLATFRSILERGWQQYEKQMRQLDPDDQTFFDLQWNDKLYAPRRVEILARLRAMTSSAAMKPMMHCPKTQLDLARLMDDKKVVLINNSYERLEDAGAELLGRLIIGMVWAAARKRSLHHGNKTPVYFIIDEAHWVIANDTKIPTIIQQTRSQKIALIVAHQELQSITSTDVKASLFNAAIKFGNVRGEAAMLAEKFDADAEFLRAQRKGTFALWVADATPTAISVTIPHLAGEDNILFDQPRLSEDEYQEILQRSREQYCYRAQAPEPVVVSEPPKKKQKPFKKDRTINRRDLEDIG